MSTSDARDNTLRRLIEAMPDVISELEVDAVLERVLAVACELTDCKYAALGVLDEDRHELERFLTRGVSDEVREEIGDPPRGRGVLGVLIEHPVPLRLADVGSHPKSYGFPPGHPPMTSFLGVPIRIRGEAWGNLYLTEKRDGEFTEEDEETVMLLAGWVGIAVENARLYQRERRRAAELEQAVRGMRATTDIARAIGGETALERVLELIVKRGRALVHATLLTIALRDGDWLDVRAAAGTYRPELLGARVPAAEKALRPTRSQRLADVGAQLHFPLAAYVQAQAGLVVPLVFRGRDVGVLYAFDRQVDGPQFTRDDEILLEAFAASAATAVATAQEFAAHGLRRSIEASERERRRWARELHDQTLQDMAGLRVALSAARRRGDPELLAAAVDDAVARLGEGIDELRAIITDLRPAALDELGPQAALEALVERLRKMPDAPVINLEIELDDAASARHTPQIEQAVYRLVQEAMTNAVKHAGATRVDVAIREQGGSLDILVADDGRGFDPEETGDGFGLIGIRERLSLVGGELRISSREGEGTELRATIPAVYRDAGGDVAQVG